MPFVPLEVKTDRTPLITLTGVFSSSAFPSRMELPLNSEPHIQREPSSRIAALMLSPAKIVEGMFVFTLTALKAYAGAAMLRAKAQTAMIEKSLLMVFPPVNRWGRFSTVQNEQVRTVPNSSF